MCPAAIICRFIETDTVGARSGTYASRLIVGVELQIADEVGWGIIEAGEMIRRRLLQRNCYSSILGVSFVFFFHHHGIAPCCGVPPSTEGKGEAVPQTFFRRESSSCRRSRRDMRSDSSA